MGFEGLKMRVAVVMDMCHGCVIVVRDVMEPGGGDEHRKSVNSGGQYCYTAWSLVK